MWTRLFTLGILGVCLTGCEEDLACDDWVAASVSVSVIGSDGELVTHDDLQVSFTVDGGDVEQAECIGEPCETWVAGWEQAGVFVVTAEIDGGDCGTETVRAEETVEVHVDAEGCHVNTRVLTLDLDTMDAGSDSGCG
ncbi:MAG: hypothetical protein QGG40_18180 [Myxococcota bacterium]|nr:hypothetical protein [Myxococcota bacterium]